ncbi:VanZ family protein [Romboutsia sp. 1001216sp1]|uniref:VanZ family protein n=1 Tax=unclassified Romboutsia TaxID=2626894 RepID=UPI0018A94D08|nr:MULTISPECIES: VanZ family protein [unclassified Romboutsia]MDB8793553.1 VanZ family protein [Romboutsia sp. 1001216sp1]MDB8794950.1 VanZ family protein [Romboutsia sp. 1001216sp1]MDB8798761.1 VanZ family protein [Romboutsia sp. 1001216sp1]
MRKKIFLILAILWMCVIFYMSNQPSHISSAQSSGVINVLSNVPVIGDAIDIMMVNGIAQFVIRKSAHMFSYAILAILWFMSIYESNKYIKKTFITSLFFTFIYACTDEVHQLFIPGRSGEIRDVLVDSTGAIIGLCVLVIIIKFVNKKSYKLL